MFTVISHVLLKKYNGKEDISGFFYILPALLDLSIIGIIDKFA